MKFTPILKSTIEKIPFPIGKLIAYVPYAFRPRVGLIYRRRRDEIFAFSKMPVEEKRNYIFQHMKFIVEHAWNNVIFYRELYKKRGFHPSQLSSFEDIQRIPVITKRMLRKCPLDERSFSCSGRYPVNTGGSSGTPLNFYISPSSMGHEWAHMHQIWGKLGYRSYDLKLCFGGRGLKRNSIKYDALRHHYAINIYCSYTQIAKDLRPILRNRAIRYLHGYPSALYDFACYCEENDLGLAKLLAYQLKGAFLGSEFPSPVYRKKIEAVFKIPTISWYGHTERAVLAWEQEAPFLYQPFQTYGFAEAIEEGERQRMKLIATAYHNLASPFIRYDTGDEISVVESNSGVLQSFRISGGREGDFVVDSKGKRISLTGLVFGRHHKIFDIAKFVQLKQEIPGSAKIYITTDADIIPENQISNYFDLSGINIDFSFEQIKAPMLTTGGKVVLNVSNISKE